MSEVLKVKNQVADTATRLIEADKPFNVIDSVHDFNHEAGLVRRGYDDRLESSFLVEEALEGFDIEPLCYLLGTPPSVPHKDLSRYIMNSTTGTLTNVDRLDKACDAVIFAIGSMAKLGLDPDQINRSLEAVMEANNAKLDCPKDSYGKLTKPDDFDEKYAPEPKLQAILRER